METEQTIAVIIPLYNGEKYIEATINSVIAQDREPDEIFVVDDGSSDRGADIVASLASNQPKIKLLRKQNGGQASARNFGIAHSTSSLIALLDQDDIWYPHHLRVLEIPFRKKNDHPLGWSYSNLDQISEDGHMVCHSVLDTLGPNEHPKRTLKGCLKQDMMVLPGASLISRSAFDAVGGFDEQFMGYEDDDLFLRMYCAGYRSVYINEALTQWRIHASSTSYSSRMADSRLKYFLKLIESFPDDPVMARFYGRDLIAPRFIPVILADFTKGVLVGDSRQADLACHHLNIVSKHLSLSNKLYYRTISLIGTMPLTRFFLRWTPRATLLRLRGMFAT